MTINESLKKLFDHPGVLLFRGRELPVVQKYFKTNNLPAQKTMLDVGCGEGNVGAILFDHVDVGLEYVPEYAEIARTVPAYKKVVVGDARKLPFANESFDIVFSNSVIEHIDGIDAVISEFSRVLKTGGKLVFTSPSKYFTQYLFLAKVFPFYAKMRNKQLNHYNLFNREEWGALLKKYDLTVTFSEYYLPEKEILFWDFMCLTLRFASVVPFIYKPLKNYYFSKVEDILHTQDTAVDNGGSVLIAATKS